MIFKNSSSCKYDIMIELKYIKVIDYEEDNSILKVKKEEAILQLESYSKDERLDISTLRKYVVVFVGNNLKLIDEV